MQTTEFILHENKKKDKHSLGTLREPARLKKIIKKIRAGENKLGSD